MKKWIFSLFSLVAISGFAHTQALSELVYEIRDPATDSLHFRQDLESIGEYLALQVLEELDTKGYSIQTLTGAMAIHELVDETPILITIMRGGIPLNQGVLKVFTDSKVGFLAMSRNEETLQAKVEYVSLPDLLDRSVIISDTMLATGGSMLNAIQIVESYRPKNIYVITAIASKPGIEAIQQHNPRIKIFAAAIDPSLNQHGYIIPGLGDAGDRCYGEKVYSSAD